MKIRIEEYVLGTLTPEERAEVEQARRYDPTLDQAIRDMEDALAPMSLAAGSVAPPASLWSRIEAAIGSEDAALSGRTVVELGDGDWMAIAPGIDAKPMWNDRTTLLRCAAGSILPDHVHEGDEHLLVLSGDLVIGGRTFNSGDYIRSQPGMDRFMHMTRTGCLILTQIGQ